MRSTPFTRPTLVAAVELLEQHSQARFNQMVLRLGLEDEVPSSTGISVANKCALLGRIVVQRAENVVETLGGTMTLGEAVIRQAAHGAGDRCGWSGRFGSTDSSAAGDFNCNIRLAATLVRHRESASTVRLIFLSVSQAGSPRGCRADLLLPNRFAWPRDVQHH